MLNAVKKLIANESGASAIEYALIAAVLSIGIIAGMKTLSTSVNKAFTDTATQLDAR